MSRNVTDRNHLHIVSGSDHSLGRFITIYHRLLPNTRYKDSSGEGIILEYDDMFGLSKETHCYIRLRVEIIQAREAKKGTIPPEGAFTQEILTEACEGFYEFLELPLHQRLAKYKEIWDLNHEGVDERPCGRAAIIDIDTLRGLTRATAKAARENTGPVPLGEAVLSFFKEHPNTAYSIKDVDEALQEDYGNYKNLSASIYVILRRLCRERVIDYTKKPDLKGPVPRLIKYYQYRNK